MSLPSLLRLRAETSSGKGEKLSDTSVILINLGGGPSQFETYDPKPDALTDYRSEFGSVRTTVPGVHFCELFPKQARIMDKLAIVRSVTHRQASHIAEHIVETGYDLKNAGNSLSGEMPSFGSIVSKVRGLSRIGIPAYVSIPDRRAYGGPHWLGGQHRHFSLNDDPNASNFSVRNLSLEKNLDVDRLENRRALLAALDEDKRVFEQEAEARSIDAFTGQAFDLITGDKAREAFNINSEPARDRDRYGRNSLGQRILLARRLVEAGVPFVKVRSPDWDDHKDLAKRIRPRAVTYDDAVTALITDLHERGLNRKVLVVAMGEFGRTPRINATGGRDHWPAVNSVMISGGEYGMGQVIGETDSNGAYVISTPYPPQSILAMMYHHLGIDPGLTFNDFTGRPRYVLEERRPIRELLS